MHYTSYQELLWDKRQLFLIDFSQLISSASQKLFKFNEKQFMLVINSTEKIGRNSIKQNKHLENDMSTSQRVDK